MEQNNRRPVVEEVGPARVIISQIVACLALDVLLIDLGMSIGFVTIVLPEVLNAKEGLSINEVQASWLGSMAFLCQPLGSIFSGAILDYFGRRRAILFVNIPHVIAWILMYECWNVPSLFVANALLGFGTGLMEAPSVTYVGEVSDSSVRGILTTLVNGFTSTGMLAVFVLGKLVSWRQAALACLVAPLISMILVFLVPETPIWLLSKGRFEDAMKSLCQLRGWASPASVKMEFDELVLYNEEIHQCVICIKAGIEPNKTKICVHSKQNAFKRMLMKIRHVFLAQETRRPFKLVIAYFFFHTFSGLAAIRPNMVNFCEALGMNYDPKTLVIYVGVIFILMSGVSATSVKFIGKRRLIVGSMLLTSLSSFGISWYANDLGPNVFSYEPSTFSTVKSDIPVLFFMALVCFTSLGIPWVLLSEMFPFRSRGIATGLAAAITYFFFFFASKMHYHLEQSVHIYGAFALYGVFGLVGGSYLYFLLPETENLTLAEIEALYKGEQRFFNDNVFFNRNVNIEQNQRMLVN